MNMIVPQAAEKETPGPEGGPARQSIAIAPMTRALCHRLYAGWENDPALYADERDFQPYRYDPAAVDRYFDARQTRDRVMLAILQGEEPIGEIQLKKIDWEKKECTLSIHLQNDARKGQGFGTRAEQLAIQYAFHALKLNTVFADSICKNTRSQHVLEKAGFRFIKEENGFRFYRCDREKS